MGIPWGSYRIIWVQCIQNAAHMFFLSFCAFLVLFVEVFSVWSAAPFLDTVTHLSHLLCHVLGLCFASSLSILPSFSQWFQSLVTFLFSQNLEVAFNKVLCQIIGIFLAVATLVFFTLLLTLIVINVVFCHANSLLRAASVLVQTVSWFFIFLLYILHF